MDKFKEIAIMAARKAGEVHKKYFNRNIRVKTKGTSINLVTAADTEAEKEIVSLIRSYFPKHNFLAEEETYKKIDSEYTWVIDPLDGTSNFSYGLPIFCVSIALLKNNEPIIGVVYDPMRDELFSAQKNCGAYLNREKIAVACASKLKEALLITGFYYNRGKDMVANLERIRIFLSKRIIGIRRLGAAALDLCYVACGRAAGFWEFTLSPWDFAAGMLIVREAGGMVTGRYGEDITLKKSFIAASNGKIHNAMLEVLK